MNRALRLNLLLRILQAAGPQLSTEQLLDRYESHTKYCLTCSGALANTRRAIAACSTAYKAAVFAAAVAAAAALSGGVAGGQVTGCLHSAFTCPVALSFLDARMYDISQRTLGCAEHYPSSSVGQCTIRS